MTSSSEKAGISRSDFLRLATFGAGGLGAMALAGCETKNQPAVSNESGGQPERVGYVVAITHGPDDPTRVMLALATVSRLPEGDNHVWFAIDGGQIAKKDVAPNVSSPLFPEQGTAAEMLDKIRDQGVHVHI